MLSLFDLLTKKELTMQEQGYLRDRLAILEAQRIPRGQGNLEMWGNLTVNSSGSAVVGEGQANRLMVWSDEHTAGISYGLTTLGDLIYMASTGAAEQAAYFENTLTTWVNQGERVIATITLPTAPGVGETVQIGIDLYCGANNPVYLNTWRLRKTNIAGSVVASFDFYGSYSYDPHGDHWADTVTDATPAQIYVLTLENGFGLGTITGSDYRSITISRMTTDPVPARLPIGSEDQFLRVSSGLPVWESVSVITSVSDTASVDLTQTGSVLSAAVLPAGVDHNSLMNYASNRHFLQTEITNVSTALATGLVTVTTGSGELGSTANNTGNWDTAYGWGNHASAGYINSSLLTTRGDIILRGASAPERYGLSVPAAGVLNYLGVANGETDPSWKSASSNPGAAASILASNNDGHLRLERLGIMGGNPFYGIHVGTGTSNSSDAQIVIARAIDDGTAGNGHAFSDSSTITRSGGVSYNSFDGRIKVNGSANYGHFATFQNAPIYNTSGTITDTYGFVTLDEIQQGTIINRYGVYIADIVKTGGTVITNKGIYIAPLANGSTNWSIHQDGNNNSWFSGKIGMGITPIYKLYIAGDANGEATIGLKAYSVSNLTKLRLVSSGNTDYGGITGNSSTGEVRFGAEHASFFTTLYAGNAERLRIDTAGKVGIGGTPSYKLHVIGTADIQQLVVKNNVTQATNPFELHPSGTTTALAYITPTGGAVFNESGDATGDLRAESDTEANMLWLDASADALFLGGSTNGIQIDKGGELLLLGTATGFDDLQFPTATGKEPASNAPTWETFTTNTKAYAFSVNDNIDLQGGEPRHGWKEGSLSEVHAHVTLKTANTSGANRYVKIQVYLAIADVNGTWTELSALAAEITVPNGAAAKTMYLLDLGDVTLTGYHVGMQIVPRVSRIAATGGTEYADDVYITQVGMHMEHNRIYSRTEYAA